MTTTTHATTTTYTTPDALVDCLLEEGLDGMADERILWLTRGWSDRPQLVARLLGAANDGSLADLDDDRLVEALYDLVQPAGPTAGA